MKALDFKKLGDQVFNMAEALENAGYLFIPTKTSLTVMKGGLSQGTTPFNAMAFDDLPDVFDPSNPVALSLHMQVGGFLGSFQPDNPLVSVATPAALDDGSMIANVTASSVNSASPNIWQSAPVTRVPKGQVKTMSKVPLTQASMLLQPVNGTSHTARYYCICIGAGSVKVAIRVKQSPVNRSLSIRIEGFTQAIKDSLKTAGFFGGGAEGAVGGSYLSLHTEVKHWEDVAKVLGAVVAVISLDQQMTPLPPIGWYLEIVE